MGGLTLSRIGFSQCVHTISILSTVMCSPHVIMRSQSTHYQHPEHGYEEASCGLRSQSTTHHQHPAYTIRFGKGAEHKRVKSQYK